MSRGLCSTFIIILLVAQFTAGPGHAVSLSPGQEWAYLGSDEAGQALCIQQFHGRVVVVSFWASWCGSCLQELRALNRLQVQYPQRLVVVAVNAAESDEDVAQFKNQLGAHRLLFARGKEPELSAAGIAGVPQTLVLNRQGRVSFRHKGFSDDMAKSLGDEVASLLGKPLLSD